MIWQLPYAYVGHDDRVYLDTCPVDIADFGPEHGDLLARIPYERFGTRPVTQDIRRWDGKLWYGMDRGFSTWRGGTRKALKKHCDRAVNALEKASPGTALEGMDVWWIVDEAHRHPFTSRGSRIRRLASHRLRPVHRPNSNEGPCPARDKAKAECSRLASLHSFVGNALFRRTIGVSLHFSSTIELIRNSHVPRYLTAWPSESDFHSVRHQIADVPHIVEASRALGAPWQFWPLDEVLRHGFIDEELHRIPDIDHRNDVVQACLLISFLSGLEADAWPSAVQDSYHRLIGLLMDRTTWTPLLALPDTSHFVHESCATCFPPAPELVEDALTLEEYVLPLKHQSLEELQKLRDIRCNAAARRFIARH